MTTTSNIPPGACAGAVAVINVSLITVKPDEIPLEAWPPREEKFPLYYPMHCHIEMSQTAAGGNYPQGMITHWEMLGMRRGA